jgi:hypothetical protein
VAERALVAEVEVDWEEGASAAAEGAGLAEVEV